MLPARRQPSVDVDFIQNVPEFRVNNARPNSRGISESGISIHMGPICDGCTLDLCDHDHDNCNNNNNNVLFWTL